MKRLLAVWDHAMLVLACIIAVALFLTAVLAWPTAIVLIAMILKGGCK